MENLPTSCACFAVSDTLVLSKEKFWPDKNAYLVSRGIQDMEFGSFASAVIHTLWI